MPYKSPENYSFITYLWVIGLSFWGGLSSYLYHRSIDGKPFSFFSLASDVIISGFVGILTFFICESNGFDSLLTAAFVGISAHMGTRALTLFQRYIIKKYFPKECEKCRMTKSGIS